MGADDQPVPLYADDAPTETRREALLDGRVPVAVYGLGKIGLPLATVYADVTGNVIGADVDEHVVQTVNRGEAHIAGEPGLAALVEQVVEDDALRAVADPATAASSAAVHVIIVPTPVHDDNTPDLSILDSVTRDIASGIEPGDMVIVECTVPPQTCEERVLPLLEAGSGLTKGEFGLAFCPERVSSGRALADIRGAYPKVIGGIDDESAHAASIVYDEIVDNDLFVVSDATTAEAVKVFEGLYRDVNIALANELAKFTDVLGIDVNEAIETANTLPFCDIHDPGPGVGGHCIPYYPYFLIEPFDVDTSLLQTAREVNDSMPAFTVRKLREEFEAEGQQLSDATVLVLGLTYRPGIEETRKSPARPIASQLEQLGAEVLLADPMLDDASDFAGELVSLDEAQRRAVDGVVLVTPHEEFTEIDWDAFDRSGGLVVIDGRDALDLDETSHRVYTIGTGTAGLRAQLNVSSP